MIFHSFSISIHSAGLPLLLFIVVEVYRCIYVTVIIVNTVNVVFVRVCVCVFVNLLMILPSCSECSQLWTTCIKLLVVHL